MTKQRGYILRDCIEVDELNSFIDVMTWINQQTKVNNSRISTVKVMESVISE